MEDRVTLWVEPSGDLAGPGGVTYVPTRTFYAYDRFAQALGEAMGRPVEVMEQRQEEAAGAGLFLMHFDWGLAEALVERAAEGGRDPARLFLLNGPREAAMEAIERGSALGAVLGDRYDLWRHEKEARARGDVFGPRSLAPALAPHMEPAGWIETEHCILYANTTPMSLPATVALYLSVCAQAR
jgi:hypothetical protein